MLRGIPFTDKLNLYSIFDKDLRIDKKDMTLYELSLLVSRQKNYVVIIDNQFISWLDDICFDYKHKQCVIPYFTFEKYNSDIDFNPELKSAKHLLVDSNNKVIVRYNYDLGFLKIDKGSVITLYDIQSNSFCEITITDYISDNDFSINYLYTLYKQACYYDMPSEFSEHEGGYTFITTEFKGFRNQEYRYRRKLGLENYYYDKTDYKYSDVRYYNYLDYIGRFKKPDVSNLDLFKYRNLRFEAYLYCNLRQGNKPVDYDKWNKLGVSKRYIKIKDDVPFFIKYYWLNNYTLKEIESWLDL